MLVWKLSLPSQAAVHPHRIFFCAFHALAVDDGGGGAGLAFGLLATLLVHRVMDVIQRTINAPIAKVTIDSAARRQILGKVTPLASRAQNVHDGVERLPHVCFAPAASPPRRRNERFDMRPLLIRQVARVSQMIPLVIRSVLVRPHPRPPNRSAFLESQPIHETQQLSDQTLRPPRAHWTPPGFLLQFNSSAAIGIGMTPTPSSTSAFASARLAWPRIARSGSSP